MQFKNRHWSRALLVSASVLSTPFVASTLALAQPALEEIVVTARKRDENLLEIPLAVTAFSAKDIENIGARNLQDIAQFSPGLYFTQQSGVRPSRLDQVLRFRGMDTNTANPTAQLSTLFYDGVYVASGAQALGLQDIERIEVIRGPQSAFFGRSTFSGAVNYVTRKPGNEFKGKVNAEFGSYGQKEASLLVEGPIIADRFSVRMTARVYDKNGQYDNAADPDTKLGAENTKSIAGTFMFTPSEQLSVMARVIYFKDTDGPEQGAIIGFNKHNCLVSPAGPCVLQSHFKGRLPRLSAAEIGVNSILTPLQRSILIDNSRAGAGFFSIAPKGFIDGLGLEKKTLRTSLSVDWEAENGISVSSITAWNDEDANTLTDSDGRPAVASGPPISWLAFSERFLRDFSQELRISSNPDDQLTWLAGVNYFDQSNNGASRVFWSQNVPDPFLQFSDNVPGRTGVVTRGVFGSLGYDILDNLNLSLEARYQEDKIAIQSTFVPTTGVNAGRLISNPGIGDTFNNFLPRVILDFKPTPDSTLYATFAKGNRPGTFNAGLLSLNQAERDEVVKQTGSGLSVDEEELLNYEIGYKGRFMDGRVTSNLTLYYMQWKNQQTRGQAVLPAAGLPLGGLCVTGCRFFTTVTAIGATDLKGIEWEGSGQVTDMLKLSATFNLADSKFKVFDCAFCQRVTGIFSQKGNRMPRVPKYSGTLTADLRGEVNADYGWFARGDFIWTTKTYEEAYNLAWTGPRTDINLRAGVESDAARFELFVTNLLEDKDYPAGARNSDLFSPGFRLFAAGVTLPPKRVIGARASYNF